MNILTRCVLLAAFATFIPQQEGVLGPIEFFGQTGIDEARLGAALTVRPGDEITHEGWGASKAKLSASLKGVVGKDPTDIATVCCDPQGHVLLYIGIPGPTVKSLRYRPLSTGNERFPTGVTKLQADYEHALGDGIQKGQAAEDDTKGYALSQYAPLKAVQLQMRQTALSIEPRIRRVLATSRYNEQRVLAAQLMGYANRSPGQVRALVDAMRDSDEEFATTPCGPWA